MEGAPTRVHRLCLCVQEVKSFEKLLDSSLYKFLIESATFHEDRIHIANAHLRHLESEDDVFPMRTDHIEGSEQLPDVVGASMLAWQNPVQLLVEGQLTMPNRVVNVYLQGYILVFSVLDGQRTCRIRGDMDHSLKVSCKPNGGGRAEAQFGHSLESIIENFT